MMRDNLFLVTFGFLIVPIYIKGILTLIYDLVMAPKFGHYIKKICFFGICLEKNDGKWRRGTGAFSPIIQTLLYVDLKKNIESPEEKERALAYGGDFAMILISVLAFVPIIMQTGLDGMWSEIDIFVVSVGVGMLFHSIMSLGITIYVFEKSVKQLGGYIRQVQKLLLAGYRFEEMDMQSLKELSFVNSGKAEKCLYYNYYIHYLVAMNRWDALKVTMLEVRNILYGADYIVQNTGLYYWLVYYYSRYEKEERFAQYFYKIVEKTLKDDKDANAKRVLAQYCYSSGNIDSAQKYMEEAFDVLEDCNILGERELERRLLEEQEQYICKKG